jgi:hypothetical protein
MPKDYQNTFAPAFIAISFLSGLLVCLFYNNDYYKKNGDIDFEIMSTEEFYISSLLVLSILIMMIRASLSLKQSLLGLN